MNRRDAFRTAVAAVVAAMMPRPSALVNEIAPIFGMPTKLVPTTTRHPWFLLDDDEGFRVWNQMAKKYAAAMAKKIDEEGWRHLTDAS